MHIDREMIRELVAVAFAGGLQESRVPTIELVSRVALDVSSPKFTDKLGIFIPPSKYIDKSLMYKGKDGHDYVTSEALFEANQAWMAVNYPKLGINRWCGVDY